MSLMKHDYYTASADSIQQLHYIVWEPQTAPVAVLQIVHGMEEYIDRYDPFARYMNSLGWAVIGHDHLGHGLSGSHERGHFSDSKLGPHLLIDDMYGITEIARKRWPDVPVCIMGHSMGSFFTRRYLCEHSDAVHAAVIMGSGWYPAFMTGTAYWAARLTCALRGRHTKTKALKILCSLPFYFSFRKEGKNAWLSVSKSNVKKYSSDPLCGFGFTAGGYEYMYRNLLEVSAHTLFNNMRRDLPMLFISGEFDKVGGANAVRKMEADYRKRGFCRIDAHIVPGKRHELMCEDDAAQTMEFIGKWLCQQVSAGE